MIRELKTYEVRCDKCTTYSVLQDVKMGIPDDWVEIMFIRLKQSQLGLAHDRSGFNFDPITLHLCRGCQKDYEFPDDTFGKMWNGRPLHLADRDF